MNVRMGLLALFLSTAAAAGSTPLQPRFAIENFHAPLVIDNPWWPLQPGTRTVLHELEDGECKVNDVVVARNAKRDFHGDYAGLAARVVTDRVWSDPLCDGKRGLLLEDTLDWYVQDNGGNVWYVGEATIEYTYDDAGRRIDSSTEGSWEAGRDGAIAGIVMFRHPVEGQYYRQEYLAGEAEDEALNERVGIRRETKLGRFHDCIKTRETTPLAPDDYEFKYYCRNVGLVRVEAPVAHGGAELVSFSLR